MAAAGCLSAAGILAAVLLTVLTGDNTMFWLAWTLFGLITLYNYLTSRLPVIRPINMGLCRGVSLLLGAAAAGGAEGVMSPDVLTMAGVLAVYIAGVTAIATKETAEHRVGLVRWLPGAALGLLLLLVLGVPCAGYFRPVVSLMDYAAVAIAAIAFAGAVILGGRLNGVCKPVRVGQTVGMLVRWLLVVQAAMVPLGGGEGLWVAVGLLAAWLVAGALARRHASS